MSKIKSKNTKPEMLLRRALWSKGVRYRVNNKKLPGTPDISITKYKLAIFVDGEYWHGYNWDIRRDKIKTNSAFWIPKIERNMQKDQEVNTALSEMDFTVFRFWGREVKNDLQRCVNDILYYLSIYPYLI